MKMSDLIGLYNKIENGNFGCSEKEWVNEVDAIGEYMNEMVKNGENIVTSKLDEEKFVKCMNVVRIRLLSSMIVNGAGKLLIVAELDKELKPYTDTVVLTILGILADEEVI